MPSDDRVESALRALDGPRQAFRSAVTGAVEQVRAFLAQHPGAGGERAGRAAAELGEFVAGRIDPEGFAALFAAGEGLEPEARSRVERALAVLCRAVDEGDAPFRLSVPPGADLHGEVGRALAAAGRVFGAAQTVELVRAGRWRAEEHEALLDLFPFRRWNRAERRIAPPVVVEVDGADLRAGGLADFLDGAQKVVLLARGPTAPAPLARLVTPGVFVMQTADAAELDRLAAVPGPAVAALVPEGAALFVHDPAGGASLAERLEVRHLPDEEPDGALGGRSAFQMAEELEQLRLLARAAEEPVPAPPSADGAPAPAAAPAPPAAEPADALAAWLLRQADLSEPA